MKNKKPTIGFIGQGWIGRNYADNFEKRGFTVVRYALETPYSANEKNIADCDIVFIAVPTPTTPNGFDASVLRGVLPLVGKGKVAVIKSTVTIGLTQILQEEFPHCFVVHSPEFLSESTATYDAAHPDRNIVGVPKMTSAYKKIAEAVLSVLAPAPYSLICTSTEAEYIKYVHNVNGFMQVVFANMLYDFAQAKHVNWDTVKSAFSADAMMNTYYFNPIHKTGRGAGGHCFIKDFEAFLQSYAHTTRDMRGTEILTALRDKNLELLLATNKDIDLVSGVYGVEIVQRNKGKKHMSTAGVSHLTK